MTIEELQNMLRFTPQNSVYRWSREMVPLTMASTAFKVNHPFRSNNGILADLEVGQKVWAFNRDMHRHEKGFQNEPLLSVRIDYGVASPAHLIPIRYLDPIHKSLYDFDEWWDSFMPRLEDNVIRERWSEDELQFATEANLVWTHITGDGPDYYVNKYISPKSVFMVVRHIVCHFPYDPTHPIYAYRDEDIEAFRDEIHGEENAHE